MKYHIISVQFHFIRNWMTKAQNGRNLMAKEGIKSGSTKCYLVVVWDATFTQLKATEI